MAANIRAEPGTNTPNTPVLALVIDDLGDNYALGTRAIRLPGVTGSILPHRPYTIALANAAHQQKKEVMLHLPMESVTEHRMSEGGLYSTMTWREFIRTFQSALASVPYAQGINNHMGSALTASHKHMNWLMREISSHPNVYFVDSRTTDRTVAEYMASRHGVPNIARTLFLDYDGAATDLDAQFQKLIRTAKRDGYALGIAHPFPSTLEFLEANLPRLYEQGIQLVPASRVIELNQEVRHEQSTRAARARL